MADLFDEPCECCGIPYRAHTEDTDCAAHQAARDIVGQAMDEIFLGGDSV